QEDARRGDVLRVVQRQLLLAGPDAQGGRRGGMAGEDSSDGRWPGGTCLVASRVADLPRETLFARLGHHPKPRGCTRSATPWRTFPGLWLCNARPVAPVAEQPPHRCEGRPLTSE